VLTSATSAWEGRAVPRAAVPNGGHQTLRPGGAPARCGAIGVVARVVPRGDAGAQAIALGAGLGAIRVPPPVLRQRRSL
jgi:hypothetical protein